MTVRPAPSGAQFVIEHEQHRAVVTEVGATLREYTVDGRAVIDGFGQGERSSDGRGQVLAPWPNRLRDGRYEFDGHHCQAALDEPARQNAIHGIVRWLDWSLVSWDPTSVALRCTLRPQPAYEWALELAVTYTLDRDGITVRSRAVNQGNERAPFGLGFHPYLTLGTGRVDDVVLSLPARVYLTGTDSSSPPTAVPVIGTGCDFSGPRLVGSTRLDTAFGDLVRGPDGCAVVRLETAAGSRGLDVWVDEAYRYLMVYSADEVESVERRRSALAIEPMTCPPNALQTGDDVVVLAPGEPWEASWGIRPDTHY